VQALDAAKAGAVEGEVRLLYVHTRTYTHSRTHTHTHLLTRCEGFKRLRACKLIQTVKRTNLHVSTLILIVRVQQLIVQYNTILCCVA